MLDSERYARCPTCSEPVGIRRDFYSAATVYRIHLGRVSLVDRRAACPSSERPVKPGTQLSGWPDGHLTAGLLASVGGR